MVFKRIVGSCLLAVSGLVLAGLADPAPAVASPVVTNWYRLPAAKGAHHATRSTWSSSNWSGYAETGHFTSILGSWSVPTVSAGATDTYSEWFSSAWLGIDGFNDTHLIQTGTEQDYYAGSAYYSAWWEILPKAETTIPEPVSPGDSMTAAIAQTSVAKGKKKAKTDEWTIILRDNTKGWTFITTQVYKGAGSSAEFIVEAPLVGRSISSIADYRFAPGSDTDGDFHSASVATTIGGALTGAGFNFLNDSGTLVQDGSQVSTPGPQDASATAFNASYGAIEPGAPAN